MKSILFTLSALAFTALAAPLDFITAPLRYHYVVKETDYLSTVQNKNISRLYSDPFIHYPFHPHR